MACWHEHVYRIIRSTGEIQGYIYLPESLVPFLTPHKNFRHRDGGGEPIPHITKGVIRGSENAAKPVVWTRATDTRVIRHPAELG